MTAALRQLAEALRDRYALERELGRGGMAVVYLARDLRHTRLVALKVLPPELASAVRLERFLREIQVAARLAHPNILPVLDSGDANGLPYYTMPLVEGESLRAKLAREKQLPLDVSLQIASEVADALAYAHHQGVVHRDIKPGNILLQAGHAVVSDLGLARALSAAGDESLTDAGHPIGTPAYMSPEQASGVPYIDGRADIYSLACVLYEMLAGEPPFTGRTLEAALASRVSLPVPSIRAVRPAVPEPVDSVLRKALAPAPEDRFANARDFAKGLTSPRTLTPGTSRQSRKVTWIALAALGLLAIVGTLGPRVRDTWLGAASGPTDRQLTFTGDVGPSALSPDGKLFAYVSREADTSRLIVRDVAGGIPLVIASYPDVCCVTWSPDNSELLFGAVTLDSLHGAYLISRFGGPPRRVHKSTWSSWSPDGSAIATWELAPWKSPTQRIWMTNKATGVADSILLRGSFTWLRDVQWSPAGDRLAFLAVSGEHDPKWTLWTIRTDGTQQRQVLEDSVEIQAPRWAPKGDAVYYLRAQGVAKDLWKISTLPRALPRLVLTGLQLDPRPSFTISADGRTLVYTRAFQYSNLWLFTQASPGLVLSGRPLTSGTSINHSPAISPDDEQIAYVSGAERAVMTMPIEGGSPRRLTFLEIPLVGTPAWSPDGRRIAFGAVEKGTLRVWLSDVGSGTSAVFPGTVVSSSGAISWSPGAKILYQANGNRNYRVLDPDTQEEQPLITNDSVGWIFNPEYSPDGRRVAVFWNRGAQPGLWVINLDDDSQLLVRAGRYLPIGWANDSKAVYAIEMLGWGAAAWGRKVYLIPVAGGEPRIAAQFPFSVSGIRVIEQGRKFVATAEETKSDAWKIDNFDPALE